MNEWISVERTLPNPNVDVLLVHVLRGSASEIFLGWQACGRWFESHFYCSESASHPIESDQITHWMPLPEPPNGE
jgi:hypothetical protein